MRRDQVESFQRDGYFVVAGLFAPAEVRLLDEITRAMLADDPHRLDRHDYEGNVTKLSLRNSLADDVFSAVARCRRIVRPMTELLGDEVYHYHHKVMVKEPREGGAWEWHQDYGYWYDNGCLWPDMASCMVAITRHTEENGCLQVVPGTSRMGRIDHTLEGDQVGADPERVERILERIDAVPLELAPGDGVFFHANLLHRSNRNRSDDARLSLITCYNTRTNDPYKEHHHPGYAPLEILDDAEVLRAGERQLEALRSET